MSQTLLFAVGVAVFAITVCATMLYGYLTLDRIYQADRAERRVFERSPGSSITSADGVSAAPVSSPTLVPE